jgi:hypothetical protein
MMAYELLSAVFPAVPVHGQMRFANSGDHEILEKFVLGFYVDCNLPGARSANLNDDVRKVVQRFLKNDAIVVWEKAGAPVAIAPEIRKASFGSSVSLV